jgi:YfiH family protein
MPDADLAPLASPRLAALPGIAHGFFTRRGGVSTGVYESLNAGLGSKDDAEDVHENRRRIAAYFGAEPPALLTPYQVHSATAFVVDGPWSDPRPNGDGLVTRTPNLVVAALSADCAPVLLADAEARVAGACHAGWKGALGGVIEATIGAMVRQGAAAARIVAAVGPCIGPASYEVGLEFQQRFETEDPGSDRFFGPAASAEKRMFDLPAYALSRLERGGVGAAEWIGRDTCAEPDLFFSNRRAFKAGESDYGRLLSAIMLSP